MLPNLIHDRIVLGFAQAAVVVVFALVVALFVRSRGIDLIKDISISLVRGISQIILVGLILAVLLKWPWWTGPIMLAAMIAAAGKTSSRRARGFPDALRISLYAIGFGAGTTIAVMTIAGVIDRSAASLVPIGSMLIANAMNANALALGPVSLRDRIACRRDRGCAGAGGCGRRHCCPVYAREPYAPASFLRWIICDPWGSFGFRE